MRCIRTSSQLNASRHMLVDQELEREGEGTHQLCPSAMEVPGFGEMESFLRSTPPVPLLGGDGRWVG